MKNDLPERTFAFAVKIVELCRLLDEKPGVSRTLANQLLRAGTSIGANSDGELSPFIPIMDDNGIDLIITKKGTFNTNESFSLLKYPRFNLEHVSYCSVVFNV